MMKYRFRWIVSIVVFLAVGCTDPQARRDEHVRAGWEFFHAGNYEKARVEFQNALQIDPKDAPARFALGQTFERLGDLRSAMGNYAAGADSPTEVDSRVAMARILLLSGNLELAKTRDDEALVLAPQNAAALAVRAGIQAATGQKETAEKTAKRALELDPAEAGAVSLLASLYMRSGRHADARTLMQNAVNAQPGDAGMRAVFAQVLLEDGDVDGAIDQLDALAKLDPHELAYEARLVDLLGTAGRIDQALALLDATIAAQNTAQAKLLKVEFLRKYRGPEPAVAALRDDVAAAPKDADLALALAQLLDDTGRRADAEKAYRDVIAARPSDAQVSNARVGLAALLARDRRVGEAESVLSKILETEPNNARALVLRGRLALAAGRADSAIADFRTALRDDPNSAPVQGLLASAYRAAEQPLLAKETLLAAVQIAPADVELRKQLFGLALDTGEWDLATTQANALAGLGVTPASALDMRYRIAIGRHDYGAALATATTLAADDATRSRGEFYRGAALQALGRTSEAEGAYRASLATNPNAAEPLGALVRIYVDTKQTDAAFAVLNGTIAKSPQNAVAQNLLGELQLGAGRATDAKASFERAIAANTSLWPAYRGLAASELALGHPAAAEAALTRGVAQTRDAALYAELGLLLVGQKRYDDAIAAYERGLELHPHASLLANNLAMLLVERDDEASRKRALELAATLTESTDPAVLDTVGWVYYRAGRIDDAKAYLERAVTALPNAPLLRYHQARALADSGDASGARVALAEALKAPRFSERDAAVALDRQLARNP